MHAVCLCVIMERQRRDSVIEWINTGGESVNPTDAIDQTNQCGEFINKNFNLYYLSKIIIIFNCNIVSQISNNMVWYFILWHNIFSSNIVIF